MGSTSLRMLPVQQDVMYPRNNRLSPCRVGFSEIIPQHKRKVTDFYIEQGVIGAGGSGFVYKVVHQDSKEVRACKTVRKSQPNAEHVYQEIQIMKTLNHPNIVKVFETFEENKSIHIIMELCAGGDPLRRIASAGHFTERQAAILMKQIFRGLKYMHGLDICHRDLKPENLLLSNKGGIEETSVKIIDFGFAAKLEPEQFLKTKVGSAYYIAPQVLAGQYTAACDLWSAGVVLYVMLCGRPPFRGPTEPIILSRVYRGVYSLDGAIWEDVSKDAKDHVRGLLTMDPKTRWTAADALRHVWIQSVAPNSTGKDLSVNMVNNLRHFQSANRLKQAALQVIASNIKEAEIQKIHDAFLSIDERGDKDGVLSIEELKIALDEAGLRCPDLEAVVREVDVEGRNFLDYNHFIAATLDEGIYCREEHCWNAFNLFDRDRDGVISFKELSELLNSNECGESGQGMVEEIMKELKPAQEGMINFEEFLLMMRGGSRDNSAPEGRYVIENRKCRVQEAN